VSALAWAAVAGGLTLGSLTGAGIGAIIALTYARRHVQQLIAATEQEKRQPQDELDELDDEEWSP